eukprot:6178662-Pleurochrysis_carterae.AAC.5
MLASSTGADTGCLSCTGSPIPCAFCCAFADRADASAEALLATSAASNLATSTVRLPIVGGVFAIAQAREAC